MLMKKKKNLLLVCSLNVVTYIGIILHSQCCFEEYPKALLTAKDSQGNTIAHLVAASGNTEVFEVYSTSGVEVTCCVKHVYNYVTNNNLRLLIKI